MTLQDLFLLHSTPLAGFKALRIIYIFALSALLHSALYYPLSRRLDLTPYLIFFLGSAAGILLERAYYHATGRRVGGWAGRVWTWTFTAVVSWDLVEHEWSSGWAGDMRGELATSPESSAVEWAVYALGWGPRPLNPKP